MKKGRADATTKAGANGHQGGEGFVSSALLCMRVLRGEMLWLFNLKHLLGQERQFIKLPRLDRTVPEDTQL